MITSEFDDFKSDKQKLQEYKEIKEFFENKKPMQKESYCKFATTKNNNLIFFDILIHTN